MKSSCPWSRLGVPAVALVFFVTSCAGFVSSPHHAAATVSNHQTPPTESLTSVSTPSRATHSTPPSTSLKCRLLGPPCEATGGPRIPVSIIRPLSLPRVRPISQCHTSTASMLNTSMAGGYALVAPGPIRPVLADVPPISLKKGIAKLRRHGSDPWLETKTLWISAASYGGPVLIRGRRLDGVGLVGFGSGRRPRAGFLAMPGVASGDTGQAVRAYPGALFFSTPGCYGLQVDGSTFSYHLVLRVEVS